MNKVSFTHKHVKCQALENVTVNEVISTRKRVQARVVN